MIIYLELQVEHRSRKLLHDASIDYFLFSDLLSRDRKVIQLIAHGLLSLIA